MMGNGQVVKKMEKEQISLQMEMPMLVNMKTENPMVKGYILGQVEVNMKETLSKD